VIADVDDLHAVLDGQRRVFRGGDALERQRHVRVGVLEALDVIPGERGLVVEARGPCAPGLDEALGEVTLAPAVHGGVHRETERRIPVVAGALDVVVDPRVVAAHVELEDAEVVGRLGHGFEPWIAHRAQHLRDAELRRGLGRRGAAARVEALDRSDGREHHRDADLPAQEGRGAVEARDVPEDAGAEGQRVERLPVAPERRLRLGAAGQIVPGPRREVLPRGLHDLLQRLKPFLHLRCRCHAISSLAGR
jgi:hypothetical protein